MKVILTTGSPHSGFEAVADMLGQAGIAQALPSTKAALTPQALQERLLISHDVDLGRSNPLPQVQPGKFWSELATDLFLSNMQHDQWGWADHQTAALMDFWHDFDTQARLLLVYCPPADYLARVLSDNTKPTSQHITAALDEWVRWNTSLLRYLHRHPDFCLLVSSHRASPRALAGKLSTLWQLNGLSAPANSEASDAAYSGLQAHLINQLIDGQHPALALYQELEGAACLIADASEAAVAGSADKPYEAWADWIALTAQNKGLRQERQHLLQQLHAAREDLAAPRVRDETPNPSDALLQENASLAAALDAEVQAKTSHIALLEAAIQEKTVLEQTSADIRSQHEWLKQESELLLQQLNAARQDLAMHPAQDDAANQRDALLQENASLATALDTEVKAKTSHMAQLGAVNQEKNALEQASAEIRSQNDWLKKESENLLMQLHGVQEELEHYFSLYEQVKKEKEWQAKTSDFWNRHSPKEITVEMQDSIAGDNWHAAEAEGRWAGPGLLSTLEMPGLQAGSYMLELDIVDAMHRDIVNGLVIEAFDKAHPIEVTYPLYQGEYPLVCSAQLNIPANKASEPWLVGLRFPHLASPAEGNSHDRRQLAIKFRTLRLVRQS